MIDAQAALAQVREAIAAGPRPGEWRVSKYRDGRQALIYDADDFEVARVCYPNRDADAAFIAACNPAAIRELLAERDALLEALQHMQHCASCAEDYWQNCEGGRAALAAIDAAKGAGMIDLDAVAMQQMRQAAAESTWMPAEYSGSDWISDVCRWLRDGPPQAGPKRDPLHGLAPTHRCPACGALWRQCDDASWNLRSASCCGLCDAGRVELVCWLDEPKREPLSDEQIEIPDYLRLQIACTAAALRWEQSRADRLGTHGPGCSDWGPSHYECAIRERDELRRQLDPMGEYTSADELIAALRAEKAEDEAMKLDAQRYRWLRPRFFAADFAYSDPPICAIVFRWPESAKISANLDREIDAAMGLTRPAEEA